MLARAARNEHDMTTFNQAPPIEEESQPVVADIATSATPARHGVLEWIRPKHWPIHRHDCPWPKDKHSWTHITTGWCSRSKPGKSIALCDKHVALHKRAWDVPNPSQRAAIKAREDQEKVAEAKSEKFENYLYGSDSTTIDPDPINSAYKRMDLWLHNEAEKEQEE